MAKLQDSGKREKRHALEVREHNPVLTEEEWKRRRQEINDVLFSIFHAPQHAK